jgi:hypothetical protein
MSRLSQAVPAQSEVCWLVEMPRCAEELEWQTSTQEMELWR